MSHVSLWLQVLRYCAGNASSGYLYGKLCATLNMSNAYRYAIGNPYRSEFIHGLAKSLQVLEYFNDPLQRNLADNYPEVFRAINDLSPPVVVEFTGISSERLRTENGGANIEELWSYFATCSATAGLMTLPSLQFKTSLRETS